MKLVAGYEPQATEKFFGAAVFQKCCRGVGEQPTFAEQIKLHDEKKQKSKRESEESQLPSKSEGCNERQGFRGNCDSQGKLGMCPSLAEPDSGGFPKSSVSHETKQKLLLGKPIAYGSAESLRCLPVCCSPVLCCPNCL